MSPPTAKLAARRNGRTRRRKPFFAADGGGGVGAAAGAAAEEEEAMTDFFDFFPVIQKRDSLTAVIIPFLFFSYFWAIEIN